MSDASVRRHAEILAVVLVSDGPSCLKACGEATVGGKSWVMEE